MSEGGPSRARRWSTSCSPATSHRAPAISSALDEISDCQFAKYKPQRTLRTQRNTKDTKVRTTKNISSSCLRVFVVKKSRREHTMRMTRRDWLRFGAASMAAAILTSDRFRAATRGAAFKVGVTDWNLRLT